MKQIGLKIVVLLCLVGCGTVPLIQSYWHSANFDLPANFVHQKNELTLSVSNDSTTLYIEIESYSHSTIKKIQDLGLSLWISKGKSPNKTYSIHYPLPYSDTKGQVALEGFAFANLVAMPLSEIAPIQIKNTFTEDAMHYAIRLPLAEIGLLPTDIFTVEVRSFAQGDEEYLSALTAAEAIERTIQTN